MAREIPGEVENQINQMAKTFQETLTWPSQNQKGFDIFGPG